MGYLDKVRERQERSKDALRKAFQEEARRLTQLLVGEGYEFKRVYLFGSTVKEGPLRSWSDIDLAIEGLREDLFLRAYALLLRNAEFSVDLKPFEDLSEVMKEKIRKEGELIYGDK